MNRLLKGVEPGIDEVLLHALHRHRSVVILSRDTVHDTPRALVIAPTLAGVAPPAGIVGANKEPFLAVPAGLKPLHPVVRDKDSGSVVVLPHGSLLGCGCGGGHGSLVASGSPGQSPPFILGCL